jgi:hypothetical protein
MRGQDQRMATMMTTMMTMMTHKIIKTSFSGQPPTAFSTDLAIKLTEGNKAMVRDMTGMSRDWQLKVHHSLKIVMINHKNCQKFDICDITF